jgi:hypothetical protein
VTARPALSRPPTPRDTHYGAFYGLQPLADGPLLLVHGNCQAESLRVLLDGGHRDGGPVATVRVPPVHELVPDDVPHLQHLLGEAAVVVVQPVRDGYHDLPLGTREVQAAAPRARLVVVPVVRHHLLHPFQGLVRAEGAGDPPVVPYHDLRTLVRAAGLAVPRPSDAALREVGRRSLEELRRRQDRDSSVPVDDLLVAAGAGAAHTVNHPGNPVLVGLARRVQDLLGLEPAATDPGRTLLGSVLAPLEAAVLRANGLDDDAARDHWVVDGEPVSDDDVVRAQADWYATRPDVVRAGLERYADTLRVLAA